MRGRLGCVAAAVALTAGLLSTAPAKADGLPAAVIDEVFIGVKGSNSSGFIEIRFLESGTIPADTGVYLGSGDGDKHRGVYLSYGHAPNRNGYEEYGSDAGAVTYWFVTRSPITVAAGSKLLACDASSSSKFGVSCDVTGANLANSPITWIGSSGAVSFGSDLVTFGDYYGDRRVTSSSARPAGYLERGQSLVRTQDTNDSYVDFRYAAPSPENQAGVVGALPAADTDSDGFLDGADDCPYQANSDQGDLDGDGRGNLCDLGPVRGPLPAPITESSWACAGAYEFGLCARVPGL